MENWNTIIVPTFYDETKEFDREKLKKIARDSGIDTVTVKNALIGKGIGFILKTPDIEKIEKAVKAFQRAGIPCLPANNVDVIKEIEVFYAKTVSISAGKLKIESFEQQSFIIGEKIILVSDTPVQGEVTVKKVIINSNKVALVTKTQVFVIDYEKTNILALDGKRGISRKANLIRIVAKLAEERKLIVDATYFYQGGFFRNDIAKMAMFIAYAYKNGIYGKQLPESLFSSIKQKQKPVFNHKVISNSFKASYYLYRQNLKDSIVYPPVVLGVIWVFCAYLGAKLQIPFFFWLLFLITFIIFTYKLFKVWKIKNIIEDTPTSKLRSVAAGFVEVVGKIMSSKPVVSPISGAPCIFFRYTKEKFVRSGRHSHWQIVEVGYGFAKNCVLRDETGEIGVNVKNASFFLTTKYTTNTTFNEMRYGLFGSENIRYTEEYILDGQKVYVLGTAKPVSKSADYGKFLSELKKDKDKMKKFDLNGDGVIDAEEWEKAQKKLRDEYLEYKQLKGQAADLIIDRDPRNGVFIISNEKETGILKRLKIALPLYFVGSLVFLVLTLWLTVKIF